MDEKIIPPFVEQGYTPPLTEFVQTYNLELTSTKALFTGWAISAAMLSGYIILFYYATRQLVTSYWPFVLLGLLVFVKSVFEWFTSQVVIVELHKNNMVVNSKQLEIIPYEKIKSYRQHYFGYRYIIILRNGVEIVLKDVWVKRRTGIRPLTKFAKDLDVRFKSFTDKHAKIDNSAGFKG